MNTCKLCLHEFPTLNGLRAHTTKVHGLDAKSAWIAQFGAASCACGAEPKFLGFIKGFAELCKACNDKRARAAAAKTRADKHESAWNSGKKFIDHQDDERFKRLSAGIKRSLETRQQWNFALTKETSEKLLETSKKISAGIKRHYSTHRHSSFGLRKDTADFIYKRAKKISQSLRQHHSIVNEKLKSVEGWSIIEELESFSTFEKDKTSILGRCRVCGHARYRTAAGWLFSQKVPCIQCSRISNGKEPYTIQKEESFQKSKGEIELFEFVKEHFQSAASSRSTIYPLELDIYIPQRAFAIEYNGIYWHSDIFKPENYHQNKTELCEQKGIRLFHVFEDEWNNKRAIVESMILHQLGESKKIPARKCKVVYDTARAHALLSSWHLDGAGRGAQHGWILLHDDNPVAAVTFGTPFHKKWRESKCIELLRSACHPGIAVIGGLSKLISAAEKALSGNYSSILTYADMRSGTGKSYEKCGFKFLYKTQPRFWWVSKSGQRLGRLSVKATEETAQDEEALKRMCFKIYGCSNKVFLKKMT